MSANFPSGRPATPPVAPTEELIVAKLRRRARGLLWSALILIVVCGAVGYFAGNLPAPFHDWMLYAAAGAIVLFLVVVPVISWLCTRIIITTRRVIVTSGMFARDRRELNHARGYGIRTTRSVAQRVSGSGTLILTDGMAPPLVLKNLSNVGLVHEVLADQVEASQIQLHRDSQGFSFGHNLPPRPPAPTS